MSSRVKYYFLSVIIFVTMYLIFGKGNESLLRIIVYGILAASFAYFLDEIELYKNKIDLLEMKVKNLERIISSDGNDESLESLRRSLSNTSR